MKTFIKASQISGAIFIGLFLFGGLLNSYGMDIKPIWFIRASTPILLIVWLIVKFTNPKSKL